MGLAVLANHGDVIDAALHEYVTFAPETKILVEFLQMNLSVHQVTLRPEGRRMVQVMEKYQRICQGGTQHRSTGQAKAAAEFVLERLHTEDRFNVIAFDTMIRMYAPELRPASECEEALHTHRISIPLIFPHVSYLKKYIYLKIV